MMTTSANRDAQPPINVATHLRQMARDLPYRRAVICPAGRDPQGRVAYTHLTFLQLDWESDGLAHGLEQAGIQRNTRTILMVKPSLEFFVLIFALFKIGAVPVVVDPGMGIRRMLACYQSTRPQVFIGIPLAHAVRVLFPRFFKTVKSWVTVGSCWFWRGYTLEQLCKSTGMRYPIADTCRDDTAAILFTTGSTGPAKGAVYTHGNFDA
jgi:acyl-CoA synthetase (AMP-forming)/AMP-acid ligase II